MNLFQKPKFYLLFIIILFLSEGAATNMKECSFDLPETVGFWVRSDSAQIIDSTNIFDYMNGGGELYLAYCFNHLEVYEYTAENQPDILVELYCLKTSDDAFGLLSLDWGGEPVDFNSSKSDEKTGTVAPFARALYGRGLLRIWSDNIYARIMVARETSESKDALMTLGRSITANRTNRPEPKLLQVLPQSTASGWYLRKDRIGYLRSHLVLNSLFYLSHQNILNLDHSTEAVTAPFELKTDSEDKKRVQVLFIKYAESKQAQQALEHFISAYLPDQKNDFSKKPVTDQLNFYEVEDGWLGYKISKSSLAIVFACPSQESVQEIINHINFNRSDYEE